MANSFSREEIVAFEQVLEGFNDNLVMSKLVKKYGTDMTTMARTGDKIWRPQPYISLSYDGMDQTGNFFDQTQLSVPATIGFQKSSPFQMDGKELRDALQEGRLGDGAKQKLASDVNVAILNAASNLGSLVVKRTAPASGFDDLAAADAIMNEQGIPMGDRNGIFSSRDMNSMASNLAGRQTFNGEPQNAYERARVSIDAAGFAVFKSDYMPRLTAAAGTGVTLNGANQYYVPKATSTATTGETENVDNRFQTLNITLGGGSVAVGDCFTIAGVNSVHHVTKQDTGQLKTFRITRIVSGGTGAGAAVVNITPPIISAGGGSVAEKQYQNVTATPATNAPLTFLNTVTAYANPFWHESALEILPARLAFPDNAGMQIMRGSLDNGIEVVMQKQAQIATGKTLFRFDILFGVVNLNTEMSGIMLFNQT